MFLPRQTHLGSEFCTFWVASTRIWAIWVDVTKLHVGFRENLHRLDNLGGCHQAARACGARIQPYVVLVATVAMPVRTKTAYQCYLLRRADHLA